MVLNVFYRQPKEKQFRDRELENNVTSAFLILLKSNNTFLNYFLDKLNVNSIKQNCKEVIFQVTNKYTIQTKSKENKYLLFINSKYDLRIKDNKGSEHTKSKDIPDGLIFDDKTAILIEAKVSAIKEESQLKRYNKAYFDGSAQTDLTTWQDIYGYILGYSNKYKSLNQCNTCDFLLNEFKGYLEVVNLSGFSGIPFFNKDERYDEKIAGEIIIMLVQVCNT